MVSVGSVWKKSRLEKPSETLTSTIVLCLFIGIPSYLMINRPSASSSATSISVYSILVNEEVTKRKGQTFSILQDERATFEGKFAPAVQGLHQM